MPIEYMFYVIYIRKKVMLKESCFQVHMLYIKYRLSALRSNGMNACLVAAARVALPFMLVMSSRHICIHVMARRKYKRECCT